jgi:hypothetical protein
MSLLERSYSKCPSCECQCHLKTETLNENEKDNDTSPSSQPSEINTKFNKECKDRINLDSGKVTLNTKEKDSDSSSTSQPSQINTKSSKACNTIKDSPTSTQLKADSTDVEDGGAGKFQLKGKSLCKECARKRVQHHHTVLGRGKACMKFVWNKHMLKDLDTIVHSDWLLYITHGFIGQCNILLVTVM